MLIDCILCSVYNIFSNTYLLYRLCQIQKQEAARTISHHPGSKSQSIWRLRMMSFQMTVTTLTRTASRLAANDQTVPASSLILAEVKSLQHFLSLHLD